MPSNYWDAIGVGDERYRKSDLLSEKALFELCIFFAGRPDINTARIKALYDKGIIAPIIPSTSGQDLYSKYQIYQIMAGLKFGTWEDSKITPNTRSLKLIAQAKKEVGGYKYLVGLLSDINRLYEDELQEVESFRQSFLKGGATVAEARKEADARKEFIKPKVFEAATDILEQHSDDDMAKLMIQDLAFVLLHHPEAKNLYRFGELFKLCPTDDVVQKLQLRDYMLLDWFLSLLTIPHPSLWEIIDTDTTWSFTTLFDSDILQPVFQLTVSPQKEIRCKYCKTVFVANRKDRVTCGSDQCNRKNIKEIQSRNREQRRMRQTNRRFW